jgi:hypothetical protein
MKSIFICHFSCWYFCKYLVKLYFAWLFKNNISLIHWNEGSSNFFSLINSSTSSLSSIPHFRIILIILNVLHNGQDNVSLWPPFKMIFNLHLSSLQSANIRTLWKDVVRMLNFRASFVYLNFKCGDGQVSWSHPGLANCSPFPMLFANVPCSRKTTIVAYRSSKRWFVYMKLDLNVE